MKKLHVMMLALFAVFAFSAVLVGTASAEATLLAEWLDNGVPVEVLTPVEISGTLNLIDLKGAIGSAAGVLCSGILDGSVGPMGEDEITKVLTLSGVEVTAPLVEPGGLKCTGTNSCSTEEDAELWPENLPWHTLAFLDASGLFLDRLFGTGVAGHEPAYEVLCLVLGINATDLCEGQTTAELKNVAGGVEGIFSEALSEIPEFANCEKGGAKQGILIGSGIIKFTEAGLGPITISSEP